MIDEKLNGLIKDALVEKSNAIKNDDKLLASKKEAELRTYRLIKAKFMEFKTAKKAEPLTETAEKNLINDMIKSWKKEIDVCKAANRNDRAESLQEEVDVMSTMVPHVSEEEIQKHVNEVVEDGVMTKMGMYIGAVKKRCPDAEGSVIASMVKVRMSQLS